LIRKLVSGFLAAATLLAIVGFIPPPSRANQTPQELQPSPNEHLLLQVHAEGDQIYFCNVDANPIAWTLKAPAARLYGQDGQPFGEHFAGPSWKANDGSQITGKAAATVPSPDANSIPWLLVTVVSRSGQGGLANVTSVQRINTKGGKAPAGGCDASHAGQEIRVPYTADYVFFAPK
jgi:Protein of unknown function (DUF3455)